MTLPKVTTEPVPAGFHKISGTSVEEVIEILEREGISHYFVHPAGRHFDEERQHTIILTRHDYVRLSVQRTFGEVEIRGLGATYIGLFRDAVYSNGRSTLAEITQLRLYHPFFSSDDHDFLEANGITAADAMRPYPGYE